LSKIISDVPFIDLLPRSINEDTTVIACSDALDVELRKIITDIAVVEILSKIDYLTGEVLDYLAWRFHVDVWDDTLDLPTKRLAIKNSIAIHQKKGTVWAVKEAVKSVGYDIVTVDEGVGTWAEFEVDVETADYGLGPARIIKAINMSKSQRSLLIGLVLTSRPEVPLGLGTVVCTHLQM
jgi:phage tail P2-like protein